MDLQGLINTLNEYGLPGLFLVSFISNAIPGFPAIYLAFVGTYAAINPDPENALLVIVVSGVGAGLGKLLVFLSSRAISKASNKLSKLREQTEWLSEEAEKGVFILVFLFAALPLPDDLLYIPLGLTGFRVISFAAAVITGKIVLTGLVYVLGQAYRSLFQSLTSTSTRNNLGLLVAGAVAGSIIVTLIVLKMDWRRIYTAYKRGGKLRATIILFEEFVRVVSFNTIFTGNKLSTREATLLLALTATGILLGSTWRGPVGASIAGFAGFEAACLAIAITRKARNKLSTATMDSTGDEEDSGRRLVERV